MNVGSVSRGVNSGVGVLNEVAGVEVVVAGLGVEKIVVEEAGEGKPFRG